MTRSQQPDLDVVVLNSLPISLLQALPGHSPNPSSNQAHNPSPDWLSASDFKAAWSRQHLPGLSAAFKGAQWSPIHAVPEDSPTDSRAQALALAHGLAHQQPWPDAAWRCRQANGVQAWVSPCHWHMAQGQTLMLDPRDLNLDDATSMSLMKAMRPYFEEDGLQLDWHDALNWRLSGPALKAWRSRDLSQAVGRDVQHLLHGEPWPAPLNRLQIEMQMLLYTHADNEARSQRGWPSVNSFWVHGVGEWPRDWVQRDWGQSQPPSTEVLIDDSLEKAWRSGGTDPWWSAWPKLEADLSPLLLARLNSGARVRVHWCTATSWRSAQLSPRGESGRGLASTLASALASAWPFANPHTTLGRRLLELQSP